MTTFNSKNFNVKQLIKDRVNKEAEVEHAFDKPVPIPKYDKPKIKIGQAGWYVFFRELLP